MGLIGTRDDFVLGLIEHAAGIERTHIHFECTDVAIDLERRTICFCAGGSKPATLPFDLIVGCDGKHSRVRAAAADADQSFVVTPRGGRHSDGGRYVSFLLGGAMANSFDKGWLYDVRSAAVVSRIPTGGALGIALLAPHEERADLRRRLPPPLASAMTDAQEDAIVSQPVNHVGGGFVCASLVACRCVALVGDAAVSPPPRGQGINHAFAAAAALVRAIREADATGSDEDFVAAALQAYNEAQLKSERAYAYLGEQKGFFEAIACLLLTIVGLYPAPPRLKETRLPYDQLLDLHTVKRAAVGLRCAAVACGLAAVVWWVGVAC
eukprot:3906951-Prymnesium_polylepis.1